jgi:hypothetical protein
MLMRLVAKSMKEIDCFIVSVIQSDDFIRDFELLHCRQTIKPKFIPLKLPAYDTYQQSNTPCGQNCRFCTMYKDSTCRGCSASEFYEKKYEDYY